MIGNPFQHPLFYPVAVTLGILFALGLLAILAAARGEVRKALSGSLFRRWQTWAIITPIYVLAVLAGPVFTLLLTLGLAVPGVREYARLVDLPPLYERVLIGMTLVVLPTTLISPVLFLGLPPLLLIIGTLQPLLTRDVQTGARHLAFAALGFGYLPWLIGFLVLTSVRIPGGDGLLLVLALSVGLSDIGAFAAGSMFGRHKLSPVLSPNKTREGLVGNIIGAALGSAIFWFVFPVWMPDGARVLFPIIVAFAAMWGDLVESLFKREFAMKDAGTWLPGF